MNDPADSGAHERAAYPRLPTTPEQLRRLILPEQRLGGYSREAVDQVLGRAAQTVELLLGEINASLEEVARLESSQAGLEEERKLAQPRSPEEIVGEVLVSAHRAADSLIEQAQRDAARAAADARRETLPVLAQAQRTLEEAGRIHRDAQATIAEAQLQADALLESARAERERLIATAVADAERRRSELEVDNMRLETAIKGLRSEWAGRAATALARLEGIALEPGPPPEQPHPIDTTGYQPHPTDANGYDEIDFDPDQPDGSFGDGVVRDLHARLPESDTGRPPTGFG